MKQNKLVLINNPACSEQVLSRSHTHGITKIQICQVVMDLNYDWTTSLSYASYQRKPGQSLNIKTIILIITI